MAKEKVTVESYTRKDGTRVRRSARSVVVSEKVKKQNKLGNHIKTGAKISGAITAGFGALNGALVGGALGGPVGAIGGATIQGASAGVGGSLWGAGAGAATYKAKKMLAKNRGPKNFDYSMFIVGQELVEFKRGKDKTKRKSRLNIGRAAAIAGTGALAYAGLKNKSAIANKLKSTVKAGKSAAADKVDNFGSKMQRTGAYDKIDASSKLYGSGKKLSKKELVSGIKNVAKGSKKEKRGYQLRQIADRLRGN